MTIDHLWDQVGEGCISQKMSRRRVYLSDNEAQYVAIYHIWNEVGEGCSSQIMKPSMWLFITFGMRWEKGVAVR